jgi:hypothetical protein
MDHLSLIRALIIIAICILNFSAFSQEQAEVEPSHHCLYEEKSLTIGIAGPYSFEIGMVGINARMYYNVGETICFGPEYAYFKTDEVEVVDFDFVGHYIFETPLAGIYPLAGLNYTIEKELDHNETLADFGIVFGAGIHRNLKKLTVFTEYSRVEFGIHDQFLTAGIMYNFIIEAIHD